jgi:phage baseplate assembly protein W
MEEEILGADLMLMFESDMRYSGLGADLAISRNGDIEIVQGRKNLGQAILHRLLTRKGELEDIGHPDYGSRLHELIGEPNNQTTRDILRLYVKECLSQETRIADLVEIKVTVPKDQPSAVLLEITVLPVGSTFPMNLVFPYFLEVI